MKYNAQMADELTGLYYLRARYYNASLGRFTQEDTIYNDGLNLYAYCNSNPVMYSDPSGFAKETCKSKVGGECDSESGINTKPLQEHHFATNKSKKYTNQFENIVNKYRLDLDEPWNKEFLQHQGRHPYAYHEFVLDEMLEIDNIAKGNKEVFLELFEENVKSVIRENPDMLYKEYWLPH